MFVYVSLAAAAAAAKKCNICNLLRRFGSERVEELMKDIQQTVLNSLLAVQKARNRVLLLAFTQHLLAFLLFVCLFA